MSKTKPYCYTQVEWSQASSFIMSMREKVFIIEQRLDKKTLLDQDDPYSYHILVKNEAGQAVACGRLNTHGRIGRIAVSIEHRGKGIGTKLLKKLIRIAEENQIKELTLNIETQVSDYYNRQKFHVDGPVYMKQGVPFQRMRMNLTAAV